MARCVLSTILDTDTETMRPACVVHAEFAPCASNGRPASQVALHTWPIPDRDQVIAFWRARTAGQRTLVIHAGTIPDGHDTGGTDCWCNPEVVRAVELS